MRPPPTALKVLLLAAGLAGCGSKPPASGPLAPTPVRTAVLSAPSTDDHVIAEGALKRRREIILSFRIPGVINRLTVDDGDRVRRGQLLAALDPTAVAARLAQAKADLDRAERDAKRLEGLVSRGAVSRQQYEAQTTAVADAQAQVRQAAFDRRWAELIAPAGGVVLSRTAQVGEVVQPGQTVVSIADAGSPFVVRALVTDKDALRLRLGAPAKVSLDAAPSLQLDGVVSRIGQQAGAQSGEIAVEVTVKDRPELKSGMLARLEIKAPREGGAGYLRAPAEAVLEAEGAAASLFVLDPRTSVARRTRVAFGGFDGDSALVRGPAPGARVITAGAGFISDGERVAAIDAGQGSAAR